MSLNNFKRPEILQVNQLSQMPGKRTMKG